MVRVVVLCTASVKSVRCFGQRRRGHALCSSATSRQPLSNSHIQHRQPTRSSLSSTTRPRVSFVFVRNDYDDNDSDNNTYRGLNNNSNNINNNNAEK